MAGKVMKSMKVSANGILNADNDEILIEVEEVGVFSLKDLFTPFNGCNVKISCTYDEEQEAPKTECVEEII